MTTMFGSGLSRGRVGTKVCNAKSGGQSGLRVITPNLTLGSSKYVEHMLTI